MLSVAGSVIRHQTIERTPPSHRYKWHKMMGATNLWPEEEREAIRQAKQQVGEES